ncbi:MAG: glycosyltransferase family 39 protein, partial [Candidatus Eremiobacteraeota bacterium]|nr:glycosyltransferase family 39 protein [Candidatus Eremiobacteraeota bacterium]
MKLKKIKKFLPFLVLGLLDFSLRIIFLGHQSLWMDEAFSVWMASNSISRFMQLIPYDAHPFLFYIFLHLWMKGGTSEAYLRFPSVICGVISCLSIYLLGEEILDKRAGFFTALLWACSMEALIPETEIRMYAYATCFSLISTYCFWKSFKHGGVKNWILYYLFASVSLFTHYYTGFIIMAQWIFLLIQKKWKEAVWIPLILTLIFSPWTPVFFFQFFHAIDTHMPRAPWAWVFIFFGMFLNARRYFLGSSFLFKAASFFSIGIFLWGGISLYKKKKKLEAVFLELLFAVPYLIPFSISHFSPRHIFVFRYVVLCAPYFFLLFVYGVFNIPKSAAYLIFGAVLVLNLSIWFLFQTGPAWQMQNWRKASHIIKNRTRNVGVLFVEQAMSLYPLSYYLSRYFTIVWHGTKNRNFIIEKKSGRIIPVYGVFRNALPEIRSYCQRTNKRQWLILCQPYLVDPNLAIPKWLLTHERVIFFQKLRSISNVNEIYLYLLSPREAISRDQ